MKTYKIGVLKGDVIGTEIVESAVKVLTKAAEKHEVDIKALYNRYFQKGMLLRTCKGAIPPRDLLKYF